MPASLGSLAPPLDFSEAGVARQFVEQVMVDAGAFQALAHQGAGLQSEHAGIGDQQGRRAPASAQRLGSCSRAPTPQKGYPVG